MKAGKGRRVKRGSKGASRQADKQLVWETGKQESRERKHKYSWKKQGA